MQYFLSMPSKSVVTSPVSPRWPVGWSLNQKYKNIIQQSIFEVSCWPHIVYIYIYIHIRCNLDVWSYLIHTNPCRLFDIPFLFSESVWFDILTYAHWGRPSHWGHARHEFFTPWAVQIWSLPKSWGYPSVLIHGCWIRIVHSQLSTQFIMSILNYPPNL